MMFLAIGQQQRWVVVVIDVKKTLTPRIKIFKKRIFYEKNKKPLKNVE